MSGLVSIMDQVAKRIGRLPAFDYRSYYPAPPRFGNSPSVIVRQSNDEPTLYEKARVGGVQNITAFIEVIIMFEIVDKESKPEDESKLDPLIEQVIDLFDFREPGSSANHEMPNLDVHVNSIFTQAQVRRGQITYGQQECYAALITLNTQFQRKPEPVSLLPELP
jgi:hypothetical protein